MIDPVWLVFGGLVALGASVLILMSAWVRFVLVLAGALLVFQSEATNAKMAYIVVLIICLLAALPRLLRTSDPIVRAAHPMVAGAIALSAVIAGTFLVSHNEAIPTMDWARDALTYFMLVALPLIGLEASLTVPKKAMARALVVLGTIAAVGFATDWLNRRGVAEGIGRVVLASASFSILAFSYAAIRGLTDEQRRVRWVLLAAFIAGALVITGTRTNVVLIVAALVGMIGSAAKARVAGRRVIGLAGILAAFSIVALPLVERQVFGEVGFLQARLTALIDLVGGSLDQDQSFQLRSISYALAENRWHEHIWWGGGLGYAYPNGLYTLDTPWMIPAKFGVFGTAMLLIFFVTIIMSIHGIRQASGRYSIEMTMARSWGVAMLALIPFGAFVEDKGTSLALMVVVALVAASARESLEAKGMECEESGPSANCQPESHLGPSPTTRPLGL